MIEIQIYSLNISQIHAAEELYTPYAIAVYRNCDSNDTYVEGSQIDILRTEDFLRNVVVKADLML